MNKSGASSLFPLFFPVLLSSVRPCRSERSRFSTSICQENVTSGCRVTKHLKNNIRMDERELKMGFWRGQPQ